MGPLSGLKIVEIKGIGPGPYAGMLLADMGAEVIVVARPSTNAGTGPPAERDIHSRGKKSIVVNIKAPQGLDILLDIVATADALIEGFRPGVAERLGFGPDACLARNPALVYGRVTGWGQTGPLSAAAGHDINYLSLTGALASIGTADKPVPPLNLIGDYAGGSLFLVMGILAALLEARSSGKGQVVDAAMTDGSASLMSVIHTLHSIGAWTPRRGTNLLDGGAHFYDVYETADGKFVSIGAIEPDFYAMLVEKAELDPLVFDKRQEPDCWPDLKRGIATAFKKRTRDEWCEIMEGTDVCFAPVLDYTEAPFHAHNEIRKTYVEIDGLVQPAPAPRFSRSKNDTPTAPKAAGKDTDTILTRLGYDEREIAGLRRDSVIR